MAFVFKEEIMILAFNTYSLIYTIVFCIFFCLCFLIILATRLETLFKQGSTWQIRATQAIVSIIVAALATSAIMGLVDKFQII